MELHTIPDNFVEEDTIGAEEMGTALDVRVVDNDQSNVLDQMSNHNGPKSLFCELVKCQIQYIVPLGDFE